MKVKTFYVSNLFIKNQCYLIYENNAGILVDPAWDFNTINQFLLDQKIALKFVLLTHSHVDHTNLAHHFAKEYNVPVFMAGEEIDASGFNCPNLKRVRHLQQIRIDDFKVIAICTPGHSSGSTCYLIDNYLFSGDTVFIEGVGICNNADHMYDSIQFLKHSLPLNTLFWPGHSFGQTPGKDLGFLLSNNIYFQFEKRSHFVNFRTRKNQPNPFNFS